MSQSNETSTSVTELATLEVLPPYTTSSSHLRTFLREVSNRQETWSGYPLLFFQDIQAPMLIYLISGWESVAAHDLWIASEENQSLIKEGSTLLRVKSLIHLAINFQSIPKYTRRLTNVLILDGVPIHTGDGKDGSRCGVQVWEASGEVLDGQGTYILKACMEGFQVLDVEEKDKATVKGGMKDAMEGSSLRQVEMLRLNV